MNSQSNNKPTISDVAAELRRYDTTCAEILSLLSLKNRTHQEDQLCIKYYADLKTQLKRDSAYGTINGVKRKMSDAEQLFFDYAVRHAAQSLKPAINYSRVITTWASAVSNAQFEIRYKLNDLEKRYPGI